MTKLPLSLLVASAAMLSTEANAATYGASFYPNDPYFAYDKNKLPTFPGQWHLVNQAPDTIGIMVNAGFDVNIKGAWANGVTGKGVVIGIIDTGVEGDHEDLAPNYLAELSKNFSQNEDIANSPQRPIQPDDDHGVSVAGVAAARGGNGIGVSGAAPYASIAGQRIRLGEGSQTDPSVTAKDISDAFLWHSGVETGIYAGEAGIQIKNNSWGMSWPFYEPDNPEGSNNNTFDKRNIQYQALAAATLNNVIFVFAAGNDRGTFAEQAQTRFLNQAEPVINVAAFGSDGLFSDYSNFGSSIFVTAPSNSKINTFGITTTDRSGTLGYNTYVADADAGTVGLEALTNLPNNNYTADFGGTSSATPLVSGIIALGKQVAPVMDVRLTKHALVKSARIVDADDRSLVALGGRGWVKNAAGNSFNANYGFGLINASAFVNKVIESAYITDRTQFSTGTITVNTPVIVGDTSGVTQTFLVDLGALLKQPLETVEAHVKMTGDNTWKDLHISLTSPSGTVSDLLLYNNFLLDAIAPDDAKLEYANAVNAEVPGFDWIFTANAFWGENVEGEWKLQAWNRGSLFGGSENITWDNYELIFNMGKLVLEGDAENMRIANGVTVKAHSLNLDYAAFVVEAGGTFTVTDSFNVYGGEANIYGLVNEAAPTLEPDFKKGNLVTVGTEGVLTVRPGGKLVASRGITVNGGYFANLGELGEFGANTGAITVNDGGTFESRQSLVTTGELSVGTSGFGIFRINTGTDEAPDGTFANAAGITLGGGYIYVPKSITTTGATAISGGELRTNTFNAAAVTLTGGTLTANDFVATGTVTVDAGALNIRGKITAPDVFVNGQTDPNYRGWYSPAGIGTLSTVTDPASRVVRILRSEIEGNLTISQNGMLFLDAKNFRQPDGSVVILSDTVHVTGTVAFSGSLYINRVADSEGNLPQAKAGDLVSLFTSDIGISPLRGDEIDTTYATITPTLHYVVRTRDWVIKDADGNPVPEKDAVGNPIQDANGDYKYTSVEDGEAYGIAVRDYVAKAINFTPNQAAVGKMFQTLWGYTGGALENNGSLGTPTLPGLGSPGPVPFPPLPLPPNDEIDPDYDYEEIFASLDSVRTDAQLTSLYDQLSPINSVVLSQTLRQQVAAQVGAVRSRAREARSSFIPTGSLWTNTLFGDSFGFNYSAPLSTNSSFLSYEGYNEETPVTLWLNGGGSFTPGKGNNVSTGYDSYAYNAAIGADYRFSNKFLFGVYVAYSGTQTDFNLDGIKNDSDSILGAIYAAGNFSGLYYSATAGLSSDSYTLKRNISQGEGSDLNGSHKGKPDGSTFLSSAEIGYEWKSYTRKGDPWSFGPSLAVQYYHSSVDGYTESGQNIFAGWQRLEVNKQTYESFTTRLGFQVSKVINYNLVSVLPEVRAAWIHEFNDDAENISARLSTVPGAGEFSIQGIKPTKDYGSFGAGFSLRFTDHVNASVDYDCYVFLKDVDPVHQITGTLRISF